VKPTVEYFRVFGCLAHVHTPDQQQIKLDTKSKKCVLLGVSEESKAYKLLDPINNRIIISKNVIFEEGKNWNWEKNEQENHQDNLDWGDAVSNTKKQSVENEINDAEQQDAKISSDDPIQVEAHNEPNIPAAAPVEGRARRSRRQPIWMADYDKGEGLSDDDTAVVMLVTEDDPVIFEEAIKSKRWRDAMKREMKAIEKNKTWELTDLLKGMKPIRVKWIFKTKLKENGEIDKFKARLVAKGYAQQYGVDYTEVFAPVVKLDTIRIILSTTAHHGWSIFQLDVKSAFLHGELNEEIYVQQPTGFMKIDEEEKVYKLRKVLYGLKQAPRAWYNKIETYFLHNGFERCLCEHTLFTKSVEGGKLLIVSLYVDDLIYTGNDVSLCHSSQKSMMSEFDMTDLGKMRYFLGVEILQDSKGIFMCQRKYAQDVLSRFGMKDCKLSRIQLFQEQNYLEKMQGPRWMPLYLKKVVGSLMYLTTTRPDLMYGVSLISRFMANPTKTHWTAAKRLLRYLKGTIELGIYYKRGENTSIIAYIDSDFAGDSDDRKVLQDLFSS